MKRFLLSMCIVGATGLGLWYTQVLYRTQHLSNGSEQHTSGGLFEQVNGEDFFPEPLRRFADKHPMHGTALEAQEVIRLTNIERINNSKKPLKENTQLTLAAHKKIADMIALQYFEHKSPSGKTPAELIADAGYAYVIVGENLAEGDFADNADLVQGWMNSPGHRANILNDKYTEIGVATEKGTFNGKKVWFAVQEFGRPLTDCPRINEALKTQISAHESRIQTLQLELQQTQTQMNQAKQTNDIDTYNTLVPKYNASATQINQLVAKTKEIITTYNAQVKSFNACVE